VGGVSRGANGRYAARPAMSRNHRDLRRRY